MSEKKFKESDVVINTQNGKEYYITQIIAVRRKFFKTVVIN